MCSVQQVTIHPYHPASFNLLTTIHIAPVGRKKWPQTRYPHFRRLCYLLSFSTSLYFSPLSLSPSLSPFSTSLYLSPPLSLPLSTSLSISLHLYISLYPSPPLSISLHLSLPDSSMFPCSNLQQTLERGTSHVHKLSIKSNRSMSTSVLPTLTQGVLIAPTREMGVGRERGRIFVVGMLLQELAENAWYQER